MAWAVFDSLKEKFATWFIGGLGKDTWRSKLAEKWITKEADKMFKGSWAPKVAGISAIVAAIADALKCLSDGDPTTNINWTVTCLAISLGWGQLMSRQDNKSSEDVGIK